MASGWKGIATGALGLVALETVLQPMAAGRLGALVQLPAAWANRFLDPSVPALHKGAAPMTNNQVWTASAAGGDWPGPNPSNQAAWKASAAGGDWSGPAPAHRQGLPSN